MAYNDIENNSTITLAKLKKFLKVDDDEVGSFADDLIKLHLLASKQAADNYCQDTFDTIPAGIEIWIMQIAALWWERVMPMLKSGQYQDLGSVDWQFDYDDYYHIIKHYRREVGFA